MPAGTWAFLETALQLHPDDRFSNASEMKRALARVLGYEPVVESNRSFAFYESVQRLKEAAIDSELQQLMSRYGNECQTGSLPRQLERLVFILGSTTSFELIIQANETRGEVEFLERQGIPRPHGAGMRRPHCRRCARVRAQVHRYLRAGLRELQERQLASHVLRGVASPGARLRGRRGAGGGLRVMPEEASPKAMKAGGMPS